MNKKYWLFAYKLPEAGYSIRFSDDVISKMEELDLPCLECITMNGIIMLKPNKHLGMYLRVKTGPRVGKYRSTLSYKLLHIKLANKNYFPAEELNEEVYGYRLKLEWNEEAKIFGVIGE